MPNARPLALADELALPLDAVTEVLAFVGRRGQGKSYAAQKLAEEMHAAGAQFVVLDPVGIWWGLRLAADGKSPGMAIPVLGGLHGDVLIEPTSGKLLADLVVDRGISVVLDVSQIESDAEKARFASEWAARFFFRKKAAPSAVHVFVEEAQEFVPQNPQREETRMLHAFQRLAKLGRNFGVGLSLITQRPQEVNKKVLNLTELLFAFQLTGAHERRAVEEWIEDKAIDEDVGAELPKLKRAAPHAWSPAWLEISEVVHIRKRWTYDASSTPKVGKAAKARELGPIDLAQLRTDMAATIERAKAEDPRELRKRIAELERALKQQKPQQPTAPDPAELKQSYQRGRDDAVADLREIMRADVVPARMNLDTLESELAHAFASLAPALQSVRQLFARLDPDARTVPTVPRVARAPERPASPAKHNGAGARRSPAIANRTAAAVTREDVRISSTQQRMLNALGLFEQLGQSPVSRASVAGVCGVSHTTGTFSNNLTELRTAGLIEDPQGKGGPIALTPNGRARVTDVPTIASVVDVHSLWLDGSRSLSGTQKRMVEQLIRAYPKPITKHEIAGALGVQADTGTFSNNISKLRTLGLLADVSRSEVTATDLLFPAGLA